MTEKETLSQHAYHEIKKRILQGSLRADEALTERQLATSMQVSRTPLRAAVSRLEREGVVMRLGNGSLMVRPVAFEQLLEIIQVRRLLEGAAAERAAGRAASGLAPALRDAGKTMRRYAQGQATSFDRFWADDDAFHLAVADAAQLRLWPDMLREMREAARRCTITRTHDHFEEQAREHLAVIDAIAAGEGKAARKAMEGHFDSVRVRFLEWLGRP